MEEAGGCNNSVNFVEFQESLFRVAIKEDTAQTNQEVLFLSVVQFAPSQYFVLPKVLTC